MKFVHIMINVENLYFADCDGKDFSVLIVDKLYENLHSNCFVVLKASASALVLAIVFW